MPMTTAETLDDLRSRILAGEALLFLQTFEEQRWEQELAELASELDRGLVDWSVTAGPQPPLESAGGQPGDPLAFLAQVAAYPPQHLFLLKDFHPYFEDPRVVRQVRDMLDVLAQQQKTLLFLGPVAEVPLELRKEAGVVALPMPGVEEMRTELARIAHSLADGNGATGKSLDMTPEQEEHLVKAVLGLTVREAGRALRRALLGRDEIDEEVYAQLVAQKRHMVEGSDLLEFFDLEDGVADIGGLEGLKEWLAQRSEAFTTQAREQGISNPKGMLLLGVQGCGKSLTARATARLLGFPLVRLDISNLLEATRGLSEHNLREALHVVETIAPSVLWLEEIDKAFAGFGDEADSDATMSRIVGRFLTWLQEHEAPVFVVATANDVSHLPPELLRRGRFDEIFFVDLPSFQERQQILHIHLQKRGWNPAKFDVEALAGLTEGCSGAELEQIVNSAIIEAHAAGRVLTQVDLDNERERTVPLSVTMEDEIFELREWARSRCRPATPEYRVLEVMEEEKRTGEDRHVDDGANAAIAARWVELADLGQHRAAIIEHVRLHDHVTLDRLQSDFAPYLQTAGNYGLVLRSDTKVVVWNRMSREFVDLLEDVIAGKRLYLNPVALDGYPTESGRPRLPAVESLPESKVDKPVWLPVELRLIPPPEGSARFSRVVRIRMGRA
jgi:hypothetical protein